MQIKTPVENITEADIAKQKKIFLAAKTFSSKS